MSDNRIVLPLDHVEQAAAEFCQIRCHHEPSLTPGITGRSRVEHRPVCLVPLLDERTRLLAETFTYDVNPDCQIGGAKCAACTGCQHDCHRPDAPAPGPAQKESL